MAEIKNYTLKFGYGRATRLTFVALTLAYAEVERVGVMHKVAE